jgi:hypothetical protein
VLDRGTTRADFRRLRQIAALGTGRELTPEERHGFRNRAQALAAHIRGELNTLLREYWNERRNPPGARMGRSQVGVNEEAEIGGSPEFWATVT